MTTQIALFTLLHVLVFVYWLGGDLGVKKALGGLGGATPDGASPWRSYLTLQLWNH